MLVYVRFARYDHENDEDYDSMAKADVHLQNRYEKPMPSVFIWIREVYYTALGYTFVYSTTQVGIRLTMHVRVYDTSSFVSRRSSGYPETQKPEYQVRRYWQALLGRRVTLFCTIRVSGPCNVKL